MEALGLGQSVTSTSKKSQPKGADTSLQAKKRPKKSNGPVTSSLKKEAAAANYAPAPVAAPRSAVGVMARRKRSNDFTPGSGVLDFRDLTPKGTMQLFSDILLDRGQEWDIAFVASEVFIYHSACSTVIMMQLFLSGFSFSRHQSISENGLCQASKCGRNPGTTHYRCVCRTQHRGRISGK